MLAVAIGAIALDTALLGLIAPLLPTIEQRTGASEAELGLALGAYALPILFVSLPFGRLSDAIGRRPLLLGGLALTVLGSTLIAASSSLEPLIAGRAIQGVGSAASWIAALALVSELAPPGRKGQSIGYALAANSAGAIGGPALGGISGDAIGFEFPFLLVAALALLLVIAGRLVLPAHVEAEHDAPRAGARRLLRILGTPPALPASVMVVVGAAALGLVEVVAPLDGDERLGLSAAAIGALFAASIALDAVAAPVAGGLGDRLGRTRVALVGLVAVAAALAVLALVGGIGGYVAGLAIFGVGVSTLFAAAVPWLDDAFGDLERGLGYGFLNLIYAIGYAVGPIGAGLAVSAGGPKLAYLGLVVVLGAVAVAVGLRAARGAG